MVNRSKAFFEIVLSLAPIWPSRGAEALTKISRLTRSLGPFAAKECGKGKVGRAGKDRDLWDNRNAATRPCKRRKE
jgi:hypothetical protein